LLVTKPAAGDIYEVMSLYRLISVAATAAVVVLAAAFVANGQQAAHTTARAASSLTPASHKVRKVLAGNGIGAATFGRFREDVIVALTPLLGHARGGYKRVPAECGVDHTITWPLLTAYFQNGRFVGYQYGELGVNATPRPPASGTVLATTRGLTIGDTLARGRRLYGGAFKISAAQGGSFAITTPHGRLTGYAWTVPRARSVVSPKNLVATVDAGDVGCPAVSP
jgi:hypothetical protein